MRIPFYLDRVSQGILKPGATIKIEHESPGTLICSGGWGFGQVVARQVMEGTITRAAGIGIACGTLKHSAHIGRLGEYAEMAAEKNMAAIVVANTHGAAQRVAPVGGKRPRLGTNAICIGMPGGRSGPFVLDFGTSATAEGKVRVKKSPAKQFPMAGCWIPMASRPTTRTSFMATRPGRFFPWEVTRLTRDSVCRLWSKCSAVLFREANVPTRILRHQWETARRLL